MGSPNGDDKGGGGGDQVVKVGDKEYSAADVQNLITQVSTNADKMEQVKRILEVADRYELTPEEFAQQATGALGVINELITQGVIDNTGKLIIKKEKPSGDGDGDDLTHDFLHGGEGDRQSEEKTEQIVGAALKSFMDKNFTPLLEEVRGEVKGVKDLQSTMIRNDYERQIRDKHPNLDSDDVSKVFGESMATKKSLWEVAKEASEKKAVREEEVARKWAEDHGIDYDQIKKDVNDLKEFGPGGAGAAALVKGKKISFDKKGDDYISPLEATKLLLKKRGVMR